VRATEVPSVVRVAERAEEQPALAASEVRQVWALLVLGAAGAGDRQTMNQKRHRITARLTVVTGIFFITILTVGFATSSPGAQQPEAKTATPASTAVKQVSFATPQEAANALIEAAASFDVPTLLSIFGPEGKDFISSRDPVRDKNNAVAFANDARQANSVVIDPKNPTRATLVVGDKQWPVPVPIVKKNGRWIFNSSEGRNEILNRRIGTNELDAIQICHGFVEAQIDYASQIHDDSGINQYAQRIISTPGKQDGLYWQYADGTTGGSISIAIARAIEEGYSIDKSSAYHGYYFKVLKGQGPATPLGKLDYVINGVMIGGFALIAAPAEYRVTGVKTFMVSYDGVVYQKDLGPDTLNIAKKIERYNPDKTWQRTDDQWPTNDSD
jgi:hypothetical protein